MRYFHSSLSTRFLTTLPFDHHLWELVVSADVTSLVIGDRRLSEATCSDRL